MSKQSILAIVIIAAIGAGCGSKDKKNTTSKSSCEQRDTHLTSCGLEGFAALGYCTDAYDATTRCEANCFIDAECNDLVEKICTGTSQPINDCIANCGFACDNGQMVAHSWWCDGGAFGDC